MHTIHTKNTKIRHLLGTPKVNLKWVCFFNYITQITPLENGNNEIWLELTIFPQKMRIKYTKILNFAWDPKGKLDMGLFFNYITQITPLENGIHEICLGLPLFSQQMEIKNTKIRHFAWNPQRRICNETVCQVYHTNHPLGKWEPQKLLGTPPFFTTNGD